MRADRADRAGRSATAGYLAARRAHRGRRLLQGGVLLAGLVCLVAAPTVGWRTGTVPLVVALLWLARPAPDPARWRRGAAGEVATAVLLEELPSRRWSVFHDRAVPGTSANLDHVAIGPTGVWLVDTKSYRAPLRAGWRSVRAGDHRVDTAPAAWQAGVVAEHLGVEIRPVLAVHGDGLPTRGRRVQGVPVIPAAALVARLRRRRGSAHLRRAEVRALAADVERLFPAAVAAGRPRGRERAR